ncbi:hypothetical protein FEM48_Zijuj07G0076900 [Ziziphus jujuba var. spinosa]|uniref:S-protein homolog n=1 Tax=Ziziphus jujuba var. spinosa TaxID=714518 RepID=A0A978V3C8_ZIZJJ|nr:hypothetical protein FEM48_Zijuj07G0076900 [Ziziphus jujuba var. spinosa]
MALFLVLAISISSISTLSAEKITVFNELFDNVDLNVHCHSNKHDVGVQVVPYGARYQWFSKDSSYTCDLSWVKKKASFVLYDSRRDDKSSNVKITLFNDLGPQIDLTVHCSGTGHDVGSQVVPSGGRYQWMSQIDAYSCSLIWPLKNGTFPIYEKTRDDSRCPEGWCFWRIAQDGLYLNIKDLNNPGDFVLVFSWP